MKMCEMFISFSSFFLFSFFEFMHNIWKQKKYRNSVSIANYNVGIAWSPCVK